MTTELLTKLNVNPDIKLRSRYQVIVNQWRRLLTITDQEFMQAIEDTYHGSRQDKMENATRIMNAPARAGRTQFGMDGTAKYYAAASNDEILMLDQIGPKRLALITDTIAKLYERE